VSDSNDTASPMHIDQHISQRYNAELEDLRTRVLAMGGLVERQLEDALQAISTGDSDLARKVIDSDFEVNAMEVALDEECTSILARRQPAASDLRLVLSIIKTITDLERMGDESQRIGRMALKLAERERPTNGYDELRHMGEQVRTMLRNSLDAFARTDLELAVAVLKEDKKVDRKYEAIIRQDLTYTMEEPRNIPRMLEIMWSARAIERIGDRACNICEYVIYFVKGRDVRHTKFDADALLTED